MAKAKTTKIGTEVKSAAPTQTTPVRNSAIPKVAKKAITHEAIAKRAYEIYQSGQGGSEYDNWVRAEAELKAQL